MVGNGWNCWKWIEWLEMFSNGWKWLDMARMAEKGWKWLELLEKDRMAGNGWKWEEMADMMADVLLSSHFQVVE